ncbi:alpha-tocopherol transfer protein-like [Neodiprion fabricii]|uniref:alpha-tocopherol transfer protein-like n=1 Tax=Neodiprion fabricii TaxID=2872261 RepID=UPI001ED9810D|nr:alpha-tocopherol transfer protein-like [Neodiprion fabricii]
MALIKLPTVEEQMAKDSELKESDLQTLRDWCKKQPHLPEISDYELILFLHSNYYRLEPTKTTIDAFFTVKTHVPEFFRNRDPLGCKELREISKVVYCIPLRGTTPDGYKVILAKIHDCEPSHYVLVDAVKLFCMIMELWIYTSGVSSGHIIVIDMEGAVFGHVARLSPMTMKKYFYYLQEALPVRLKAFHFVNTVPFMDLILNMIKPFMKKELLDMLFLHTNVESLSKKIPIDLLTNDLGGKIGSEKDLWAAELQKLEEHRAWFQEDETRRVNESLRPGKAKNVTDIFGVEGSFKKLDID